MLENKQKIAFNEPEIQEVIYGKTKIKVKPFLSLTDQLTILTVYLEEYFSKENSKIIESEYKLVFAIFDLCTDVDVKDLRLDSIFSNYKIWEEIRSKIRNYGEFRSLLARTVEEIKETKRLEKTLGSAVENLMEKFSSILNTDISQESVENIQKLLKSVEESSILKKATEIYKDK